MDFPTQPRPDQPSTVGLSRGSSTSPRATDLLAAYSLSANNSPVAATSPLTSGGVPLQRRATTTSSQAAPPFRPVPVTSGGYFASTPIPMDMTQSSPMPTTLSPTPSKALAKRNVKDFTFGRILGEGSYSTVMLGTDKTNGQRYAVKILDKRHIIKEKKTKYVNIEKNTLSRLSHPLIVRLHYAFQDSTNLYFVLDYAENGELLALIRRFTQLPEPCVRFYMAEIITAVEYLHHKHVVHRDLKPENILLGQDMHIKLTDFGTAKLMDNEPAPDARSNSFVGTAEYVSPELLTDKAVGRSSDIWAIGCILYQLLAGKPPFKGSNEYQTFQKIIRLEYTIPDHFSPEARDLVTRLLVLNPLQRLAASDSDLSAIKNHPFFHGLDWDVLHLQTPPELPAEDPEEVGDPGMGDAVDYIDDSDFFQRLQHVPLGYAPAELTVPSLQDYSLQTPFRNTTAEVLQPISEPPLRLASPTVQSPPPVITSPPPNRVISNYYDPNPSQSTLSYSSTRSPPDPHFHNLHHCEQAFNEGGKLSQSAQPWTWRGRLRMKTAWLCPCFCSNRT